MCGSGRETVKRTYNTLDEGDTVVGLIAEYVRRH
jgi:hypothetical protein